MKHKYLTDSIELIKNISSESKNNKIRLRNIILSYADEFAFITEAIKQIDQYKTIIEPAGEVAWNEVKPNLKACVRGEITIFEFFFLDLLQIIKKCYNQFQIAMAICRNIPLINRGIKEFKGEKNGK